MTRFQFDIFSNLLEGVSDRGQEWIDISPEHARKLVEGAVAYARSYGLQPHHEWSVAALVFGDIDATQCLTEITFGKDGKPIFMPGPMDGPERVQQIMETLARTAGPEAFHFVTPVDVDDDLPPEQIEMIEHEKEVGDESELRHGGA